MALPEPQSSDPETERYLLFNAVAGLLGEAAETVPLCVVLDDLHWADAQSLALLKHVLRALEQGSAQLIATFRELISTRSLFRLPARLVDSANG